MVAFAENSSYTRSPVSPKTHTPWGRLQVSGYRYYSTELGRWPSRDPLFERACLNLYALIRNRPVNGAEFLGLSEAYMWGPLGWWVNTVTLDIGYGVRSGGSDGMAFSDTITVNWKCHVQYICKPCDHVKKHTFKKTVMVQLPDITVVQDASGNLDVPKPSSIPQMILDLLKILLEKKQVSVSRTWKVNKLPGDIDESEFPKGWLDHVTGSEPVDLPPNSSGLCE
jgi:RHS repeat-associated protein